jgi:hypothetical protein
MFDLWWTKWQLDRIFSEFFGFLLSVSFHRGSAISYVMWGMSNKPVTSRSSETHLRHRHELQEVTRVRCAGGTSLTTAVCGSPVGELRPRGAQCLLRHLRQDERVLTGLTTTCQCWESSLPNRTHRHRSLISLVHSSFQLSHPATLYLFVYSTVFISHLLFFHVTFYLFRFTNILSWDFRFSWQRVWTWQPSGILHCAAS